jgi:predicted PurR-regulated permease PerM
MSGTPRGSSGNDQSSEYGGAIRLGDVPTSLAWKLAAIVSIALVVGFLFLDLLQLLIRPLGILFASIVVAITLAPIVEWLERWMSRLVAVLLIYFGLVLVLAGFGFVLIPPVVSQTSTLVQNLPDHYRDAQVWLAREMGVNVRNDVDQLTTFAEPAANYLLGVPGLIIATGVEFLVAFFVSLYWLHSMPRMKAFAISLFPPDRQARADEVMHRVAERMGGYMRGVILAGAVVGVAVYIGLTILGVQYALLLALLAFLGEFFPNVGPVLAGIPAVLVALYDSPSLAIIVIVFYIVIQQIESYILMPFIMMRSLAHIPPLVTTFAVFTGFMVGGVLWAILAIPLSGALLTLSTEVFAPAIRRMTGSEPVDSEFEPHEIRRETIRPRRSQRPTPAPDTSDD